MSKTLASDSKLSDATRSKLLESRVKMLTGILCTFDTLKRDMEIKILLGCTNDDLQLIQQFHGEMFTLHIPNPEVNS